MNLFAYGTLMDQEIMTWVSGIECKSLRATLLHYACRRVLGEAYPAIVRKNGDAVNGVVYFDLPPKAFDRLDRFEGSLYIRTEVVVVRNDGKHLKAQTYVIAARFIDRLSEDDWNYQSFLKNNKADFKRRYQGFKELD